MTAEDTGLGEAARLAALQRLRDAGLRPTRQRVALAILLFAKPETRHVTAEQLFAEATAAGVPLSLATVYNTLHQFTAAGMVQPVLLQAGRNHFDTNTGPHQHVVEAEGRIIDIPSDQVRLAGLPSLPEGTTLERVDVVIRVRRTAIDTGTGTGNA